MDIQQLIDFDKSLLLKINGSDSSFWDGFMWTATSTYIWIPTAIVLLYVIMKNNILPKSLFIIFMVALLLIISDRLSAGMIKPYFQRWRPSQDPSLMYFVDVVNGYRGGRFGFVSNHAANSFALIVFLSLLFRRFFFTVVLVIWASIACISRIYLGVHYVGDILGGALLGSLIGYIVYLIYNFIQKRYIRYSSPKSSQYTSTGFLIADFNYVYFALITTYFVIIIVGFLNANYMFL